MNNKTFKQKTTKENQHKPLRPTAMRVPERENIYLLFK